MTFRIRDSYAAAVALVLISLLPAGAAHAGPLECDGREATIVGTAGDDDIEGTSGDDVIVGLGGDDIIKGAGGADVICGNAGNDGLFGYGIQGDGADDQNDVLYGNRGFDLLVGDGTIDEPTQTGTDDILRGGEDSDSLVGRQGSDEHFGGPGSDEFGDAGESLPGERDVYTGGEGIDILRLDDDRPGDPGAIVDLAEGFKRYKDEEVPDTLVGIENLDDSEGPDHLFGNDGPNRFDSRLTSGDDVIDGRGGDDYLVSADGDDELNGGGGHDIFEFSSELFSEPEERGLHIDLRAGTGTAGGAGAWELTFESIESVQGTFASDVLLGDGGANMLFGSTGEDVVKGRSGNDLLVGGGKQDGAWRDEVYGGRGTDNCVRAEFKRGCER